MRSAGCEVDSAPQRRYSRSVHPGRARPSAICSTHWNLLELAPGALGYLNLAYPTSYTSAIYVEPYDAFYGAGTGSAFYLGVAARTWSAYTNWFGARTEGRGDLTTSDPMLDPSTFALDGGSPAMGAGTPTVRGVAYAHVASCPIADSAVPLAWPYCGAAPDMGSS